MTQETSLPSVPIVTAEQQTVSRLSKISRDCLLRVWEIRDTLQSEMTPREMADARMRLTGYYSTLVSSHNKLDEICTLAWIAQRENYNSDTRTSKVIDASEAGVLKNKLKNEMRAIEKMISALKQRIEIMQGEQRNQY